jgi:hypothetical protein
MKSPNRPAAGFIRSLWVLVVALLCIQNSKAQTCATPISITVGTPLTNQQPSQTEVWYRFQATQQALKIKLIKNLSTQEAVNFILYNDNCSPLIAIDSGIQNYDGSVLLYSLFNINSYYKIKVITYQNPVKYSLSISSITSPPTPCNCINFPPPCERLCNGSFEDNIGYPNNFGEIHLACPWQQLGDGSSDYFHVNGNAANNVSVPFAGPAFENPHSGNAYTGFWAFNFDNSGEVREYVSSALALPLIANQTYEVSFWVSLADHCAVGVTGIGAYLSSSLPQQSGSFPVILTPQIIESSAVIQKNGWYKISQLYTANGTEQFITIGQFDSNANSVLQSAPNNSIPIMFTNRAYYFLDDVSIKKYTDVITSAYPSSICAGQSVTLTAAGIGSTPFTYSWLPSNQVTPNNGMFANATPQPPGPVTYSVVVTFVNGCVDTATVSVNISSPAVANAGPDQYICPGQQVTLNGTGIGTASYFYWEQLGGPQLCYPCTSTVVTPTVTTSYIYHAYNSHGGCADADTMTVFISPPQNLSIVAPPGLSACLGSQTYSVAGGPYVSYSWTSTGTPSTGSGATFTTNITNPNGGTIIVTCLLANGCTGTDTLFVPPCCTWGTEPSVNNDSTSNLVVSHPGLTTQPSPGSYQIMLQNFTINGVFYVDQDLRIRLSNLKLGPDARIIIRPGKKLIIDESHLWACSDMWDGIYVDGTNPQTELQVVSGSSIQDAKNAIVSTNRGKFDVGALGTAVKLNKNYIAIWIKGGNGTHPGKVRNTILSCDAPGQAGANANTFPGTNLRPPYSNTYSLAGIKVDNTAAINIGDSTFANERNLFERCKYGVVATKSTVNIYNNTFKYMKATTFLNMTEGIGVYAVTNSALQRTANIGRNGTAKAGNTFIGNKTGIRVQGGMNLYAEQNKVDSSLAGIICWQNNNRTLTVNNNTMIEFQYGILYSNNIRANTRISNNQLNQSTTVTTSSNFGNTGIMVINGLQPTNNAGSCRIYNNEIRRIRNGIWTSRVRNAKIYDNEISFDPAQNFTTASPGTGIRIEGMTNARVSTNNIRNSIAPVSQPAPTLHSKLFGISVENCLNDSVYKNTCFKVGSGIFYKGNNNPSFIACNTLDTCAFGINFNFVNANGPAISLNKQILYSNTTPTPTGNVWRTNTWDLIGAITQSSQSDWFINNSYSPSANMLGVSFVNITPLNLGNQSDQCSSLLVANPVEVQRDYMLRHIIIDPISYDTLPDEMSYIDRVYAHEILFDNPDWLYQGKVEDVQYQQFFQNEDMGNTGLFYRAEMALADGNLIAAQNFINAIVPQNEPEANRLEVLNVYIDSWGLDSLGFTPAQTQVLTEIATKEYVVSGGGWVYNARNMLFREVHDSTLIRVGRPVQVQAIPAFYPNPATGTVSISVEIEQTDIAQLQIFDLSGRVIFQQQLTAGNSHRFDVSALPAGVYVGRLIVNGEIRLTTA